MIQGELSQEYRPGYITSTVLSVSFFCSRELVYDRGRLYTPSLAWARHLPDDLPASLRRTISVNKNLARTDK